MKISALIGFFFPKAKPEIVFVEARSNGRGISFISFNIQLKYFLIPWEAESFT